MFLLFDFLQLKFFSYDLILILFHVNLLNIQFSLHRKLSALFSIILKQSTCIYTTP